MDRQEIQQRYYQNNRDKLIEKARQRQSEYYEDDNTRAEIQQRSKSYYQNNREKVLKKLREKRQAKKSLS
jgi:hypothetical protein